MPETICESNYDGEITCPLTSSWQRDLLRLFKVTSANQSDRLKGCFGLLSIQWPWSFHSVLAGKLIPLQTIKDLLLPVTEAPLYIFREIKCMSVQQNSADNHFKLTFWTGQDKLTHTFATLCLCLVQLKCCSFSLIVSVEVNRSTGIPVYRIMAFPFLHKQKIQTRLSHSPMQWIV